MTPGAKEGVSRVRMTPKALETRARIIRGALQSLEKYGLHATTTRTIAEEAEVRLATLHYHFDSKDDVLLEVLDGLVNELMVVLKEGAGDHATAEERIAALMYASWDYVARTRSKQIVQYELTLYALRNEALEWLARRQYDGYVEAYAAQVRGTGNGSHTITASEANAIARLLLAGVDGLILQVLSGAQDADLRAGLEALIFGAQEQVRRFQDDRRPAG